MEGNANAGRKRILFSIALVALVSLAVMLQACMPYVGASEPGEPTLQAPDASIVSSVYLGSMFLGGTNGSATGTHGALDSAGLVDHAPIDVDGNAQFSALATAEGWPGNGSAANPYLILGYHFALGNNESAITVANVDLCFSIRDCVMEPETESSHPITGANITASRLADATGLQMRGLRFGLLVDHASDLTVKDCYLVDNGEYQALMIDCTRIRFFNNSFEGAACGIGMDACTEVMLQNNSFLGMEFAGCEFQNVVNATFWSNTAEGCCLVVGIGSTAESIVLPLNNTANGDPIFFQRGVDLKGGVITGIYGYVWLYECRNGTVSGLHIDSGPYAVDLEGCAAITLRDSELGSGKIAVGLRDCQGCVVKNCTLASAAVIGTGVLLQRSTACELTDCSVRTGGWGILVLDSQDNKFERNTVEFFLLGAVIDGGSGGNRMIGNTIRSNLKLGIQVEGNNNTFLSNSFVDNGEPGPVAWAPCANDTGEGNIWNTSGMPHGFGNYWANFSSASHDGILDDPVPILTDGAPIYDRCALAYPPSTPSQPLNLSASSLIGGVRLTWSVPGNVSGSAIAGYTVYRLNGSTWTALATITGNSFLDTGVNRGATYQYHVTAWNLMGEGDASNAVSIAYQATPNLAPFVWAILLAALVLAVAFAFLWRQQP